jgi:hypothetical protein
MLGKILFHLSDLIVPTLPDPDVHSGKRLAVGVYTMEEGQAGFAKFAGEKFGLRT